MKEIILALLVLITLVCWGIWACSLFTVKYDWDTSKKGIWLFLVAVGLTVTAMAWSIIYGA